METNQPNNIPQIAAAFTKARLSRQGLVKYPGELPETLEQAYAIQDAAIKLWPHKIGGWKVGGIGGDYASELKETKLAGPVFENQIFKSDEDRIDMPVFVDGFAAIEGEIVIFVNADVPEDKFEWTLDDAEKYVGSVHIGVEIASSPFPQINDLGPLVTISDFGNNNGLIIGPELLNWKDTTLSDWVVETIIDDKSYGTAIPQGPLASFRFLLENAASRGMPLRKGMAITTGAITGVHQAYSGQSSIVKCSGVEDINLALTPY